MEEKQDKKVVSRDAKTGKVGRRSGINKQKNVKVRKKDFDELLLSLSSIEIVKHK